MTRKGLWPGWPAQGSGVKREKESNTERCRLRERQGLSKSYRDGKTGDRYRVKKKGDR
ncbi:hypothetical protein GCM10011513_27930 [Franconibacter daqui]|nr:hypothetical protein GCM10011513_27930 [Franconibacter daqui]